MNTAHWEEAARKLYLLRWHISVVAVLAHCMGMFHRAAMAPVADRVMAEFEVGAVAFGVLGAVYYYIYAAMQLPSGILADTLGSRKTITCGLLLSALGSVVMGAAPSFGVVFLGRVLVSFGVSVVWLSVIKILMEWFRSRELATVTGLSASLAQLGQIAATTPLALLIMWTGWRMSFVSIGLVSLGLAVANWFIVRDNPSRVGLPSMTELERGTVLRGASSGDPADLSLALRFKIVSGNKYLWPLVVVGLGTYGAYATLFHNWAVVYLMQTYGVERHFAANFVLVSTIGMMVGLPVAGAMSDRVLERRRVPLVVFTGLSVSCYLLLTFWNGGRPPLGALYPLCFLIGLGTGAMPITFASVRELVQPSVRGIASGLVNMGSFVGPAIAQPLFGYILDLGWQGQVLRGARVYPLEAFQGGLMLCCALVALGLIGALLMKETGCRESYGVQG